MLMMDDGKKFSGDSDAGQMLFRGLLAEAGGLVRQIESVGPRHSTVTGLLRETEQVLGQARRIAECLQDALLSADSAISSIGDDAARNNDAAAKESNDTDHACCGKHCFCQTEAPESSAYGSRRLRRHRIVRRPRHDREEAEQSPQDVAARFWLGVRRKDQLHAIATHRILNSLKNFHVREHPAAKHIRIVVFR